MCRPSLVQPKPLRQLRDVTRYRPSLVREQTREKQRLEKLLEDAQIKLDSVISDLHGVSGRKMLDALVAGERDPTRLAELAHGRMRVKLPQLRQALTGFFDDHHAFLAAAMLRRIDTLAADIAVLDTRVDTLMAPFAPAAERLDEVPGIGLRCAQELIAEIGVDMSVFPTAAHLVSWAKFAPIDKQSAGRAKTATTGKGNPWLAGALGEITAGLARTDTFLAERYRRLARRRGTKRAIVAIGNSVLTIIWHLLTNPQARYRDLGPDYPESRVNQQRRKLPVRADRPAPARHVQAEQVLPDIECPHATDVVDEVHRIRDAGGKREAEQMEPQLAGRIGQRRERLAIACPRP